MAEDLALRERVKKLQAELNSVLGLVNSLAKWMTIYGPFSMTSFTTVADMLQSNPADWSTAECTNYAPGDGIMSIWVRSADQTRLPNGTDVLQTAGPVGAGISLVRIFVRETDSGVVLPASLTSYTVSVPVVVPTITDLQNSVFSAPLVWVGDPARPMAFVKGDSTADNDGVNGVLNAAGIHYDRLRFE